MQFEWHENKNKENLRKHDIGFESQSSSLKTRMPSPSAMPLTTTRKSGSSRSDQSAPGAVLFVVHRCNISGKEEL
jgi:uncharacterized DUF497 family protein